MTHPDTVIKAIRDVVEAFDELPSHHPARYAHLNINGLRAILANHPAQAQGVESSGDLLSDIANDCLTTDQRAQLYKMVQAAQGVEAAFKVYKGDVCFRADADDQSFGMWCPVSFEYHPPYPEGTKFYTHPSTLKRLSPERVAQLLQSHFGPTGTSARDVELLRAIEDASAEHNGMGVE